MIDEWYKPDEITFEDLWEMGWDGDISKWRDAKMYDFSSGQLIREKNMRIKINLLHSDKGGWVKNKNK